MKRFLKELSNYRYWVLTALMIVAIFGIFCIPADELPKLYYLYVLITSKAIGITALWAASKLLQVWERKGTIPALFAKITDEPNNN